MKRVRLSASLFTRIGLVTAVAGLAVVLPVAARADTVVFKENIWFDVNAGTFERCDVFEPITYTGRFHELRQTVRTDSGAFHFHFTQTVLLEGVGETTGLRYRIVGGNQTTEFSVPADSGVVFVQSATGRLLVQAPGSLANFVVHTTIHTTVHVDGTVTGVVDITRVECRG